MGKVIGKLRPIKDKVIVHNMHFGDQSTSGGIIVLGDDGKDRGIYPRWGQVFAVGPEHKEEFGIGDWILLEHGRWTRGILLETEDKDETTIRMVDNKCILMWSKEKPSGISIGDALSAPTINEAYRLENKQ
jgi:co-chaperonin GroES (HSP10)